MPRLIDLWERIVRRAMGIKPVTEGSVVGYAIRRYPGRSLTTPDGVSLRRGDPVIELHLDSRQIEARTAGATAHGRVLFLRREMLAALRAFAGLVRTDPALARTQGIWALTLMHRGVEPFGFTVIDVPPSLWRSLADRYLKLLLKVYHPEGEGRLHQREEELVAKEIFMPQAVLLSRYGEERRKGRTQPEASSGE
jgi:hypothetical protein